MKNKKKYLTIVAIIVITAFAIAGCGKTELILDAAEDGTSMNVEATNAGEEDAATSGTLNFKDGDKLTIEPAFEEGEVVVKLIPAEGIEENDNANELESALDDDNAVLSEKISGDKVVSFDVHPGEYYVKVVVTEEATGTATIKVEKRKKPPALLQLK